MESKFIQRQLRLNAQIIQGISDELVTLKFHRKAYYEAGEQDQARVYSPFIRKFTAKLRKLHQLQKELKKQLKQRYILEEVSKRYDNALINFVENANGIADTLNMMSVENVMNREN